MPPMYDWDCTSCGEMHTEIMSYDEYDAADEVECQHCGTRLTKDSRIISGNIKAIVKGVRKGHYNSGDFS